MGITFNILIKYTTYGLHDQVGWCFPSIKLIEVIRSPIQPANAIGFNVSANPSGIDTKINDNISNNIELPRIVSPLIISVIGIKSEVINPIIVTGTATIKPAKGPEIPTSNKAFLLGIGSWLEISAPNVPILKPGRIGGIGIKKGSDV